MNPAAKLDSVCCMAKPRMKPVTPSPAIKRPDLHPQLPKGYDQGDTDERPSDQLVDKLAQQFGELQLRDVHQAAGHPDGEDPQQPSTEEDQERPTEP